MPTLQNAVIELESAAADSLTGVFSIDQFLSNEQHKDLLRFSTAGSVDDGKSTLIGRLLYDSRNVYEDHVTAVTRTHGTHSQPVIDFAQLTDGLRAEREQGITIDVAYRYFSTQRRKFIIADTPGHEQYTRNMATGASTADLAIIVIDARKGILLQSRRHAYIASLLGIRHLAIAVNKMDLVDFSEEVFTQIARDFRYLASQMGRAEVEVIPVSALEGDNVVSRSNRMPWYQGLSLLEHLEAVPAAYQENATGFRLPVQRVIRPHQNYRGFAGQIAAGSIRPGDQIIALPSGRTSRVATIDTFEGSLDEASAPQSIAISLEDELDISRGDLITAVDSQPQFASLIEASLVWFDGKPLESNRTFLLKHATQTVNARIRVVRHRVNIQTLEKDAVSVLAMNDIGVVEIETSRPLYFDSYQQNRATGSFILIDLDTNATAAAGMIRGSAGEHALQGNVEREAVPPTNLIHRPAVLVVHGPASIADFENVLLDRGCNVVRTRVQSRSVWNAILTAGVILLVEQSNSSGETTRVSLSSPVAPGNAWNEEVLFEGKANERAEYSAVLSALESKGILLKEGQTKI